MSTSAMESTQTSVGSTPAPSAATETPVVAPALPVSAVAELIAAGGLPALMMPRAHALGYLRQQYDKGVAIYRLRVHHVEDLDDCRAKKLGWTIETTELLTRLFGSASVADFCNDWVGKIHPEYADFGNFVEQFYTEMTHRLKRLREVQNRLEATRAADGKIARTAISAPQPPDGAPAAPSAAAAPMPVPIPQSSSASARDDRVLLAISPENEPGKQLAQFLEQLGVPTTATEISADLSPNDHRFALLPSLPQDADSQQVFRLGMTAGRLGKDRVCILNSDVSETARCSAFGLSHLNVDPGGGWRLDLARLLKRAGFSIDLNRLCA